MGYKMNKQLIDRNNVLNGIEELKQSPFVNTHDSYVRHMMRETLDVAAKLVIEAEPIAEARKHGTWKCYYLTPLPEKFSQCSECGAGACSRSWNYCPHCGARCTEE